MEDNLKFGVSDYTARLIAFTVLLPYLVAMWVIRLLHIDTGGGHTRRSRR